MPENRIFEAVANLILQSISVWEDMHLYAVSYSAEYNTFWGLLDDRIKGSVYRYQTRYREERLVPFSMGLAGYYKVILTKDNFSKIKDQHWKKQLKTILTDNKFRAVMNKLNLMLQDHRENEYRNLRQKAAVNDGRAV